MSRKFTSGIGLYRSGKFDTVWANAGLQSTKAYNL